MGPSIVTADAKDLFAGRFSYYAERTPELPQTLKFVIHETKYAPVDSNVTEYLIASAFYTNAGSAYESRGETMANFIADGQTPGSRSVQHRDRRPLSHGHRLTRVSEVVGQRDCDVTDRHLPGANQLITADQTTDGPIADGDEE